ncbi:ABC transporter ATP-binding protein [Tsukamurella sp. 8F]|uniref:ABC transporter ATP-binding protein n=1 Tax=unclassified Tsukamurella TaxID=2633480 RepID=UPI0023B9B0C1|nr:MULTISPECIES: ABC transporter ATP-binding protein [unclassified Tsukamurella]MDF0529285.1 ABC transporter ATP-binding protein [Tsukamurella sp. 8J]MDF0586878.1 ABC transporter ATP-binding protein [Tsukamurella sp. 8F]
MTDDSPRTVADEVRVPPGLPDDAVDRTVRRQEAVTLEHVEVRYGETLALRDCSFAVARGETVALLGPSGSGKSTALKAIAGFEPVSAGRVTIDGRDVTHASPARRGIGIVVQSYALFPHMSVRSNVGFGLKARRADKAEIRARVDEVLRMVGMLDYADRLPKQLSGGQQQRIAIARALATRPGVILLDEPLSALDAAMRRDMLAELQRLRRELPDVAMVYVTHDQSEALALADRIAIMRNARLETIGAAERLFSRPPSEFTASFLGGADILPVRLESGGGHGAAVAGRYGDTVLQAAAHDGVSAADAVCFAVRPWAWRFTRTRPANGIEVVVENEQWRGATRHVTVEATGTGQRLGVDVPVLTGPPLRAERLWLEVDPTEVMVVPAEASAGAVA